MHIEDPAGRRQVDLSQTPEKKREQGKLKEACQEFESLLLGQMLSQMRTSVEVMKSNLFGEGKDEEVFASFLDQERAKAWSQSGGIGLASILYQQLKNTI